MSKPPAQQPKWNIYESSLLLETYLKCKDLNSGARKPYLEELSRNLRKIAVNYTTEKYYYEYILVRT